MGGACQPIAVQRTREPDSSHLTCRRGPRWIRRNKAKDDIGSFKDTVSIEKFFAAAYRKANREEALVNILVCKASRVHFIKFLEMVYYVERIDELTVENMLYFVLLARHLMVFRR
jgi:hypothetical protein